MSRSTRLSRKDLYELVWSDPIKSVAPRFNISDVALSKICRKHDIPRPPRGYWAKLAAGKPVSKTPLPNRGLGMSRFVEMNKRHRWGRPMPDDPEKIEIPEPTKFRESDKDLEARVRKMVGKVTVPRDLRQGHHAIRRLLEQDDERRDERRKKSYTSSYDNELFSSPFERRRLRLINAIFIKLGRCGVKASTRGKDPEEFYFEVGEQNLSFKLDHSGVRRYGSRYGDEVSRPASLPMEIEIGSWRRADQLQYAWKDEKDSKLERRLTDIVVTMIMAGELHYRLGETAHREWLIQRKAELIEEAKQREEERRRALEEEARRREQERIDRLLEEAETLQKAETIRLYVARVREFNATLRDPASDSAVDEWANHALAQADRIDPVVSGRFLQLK